MKYIAKEIALDIVREEEEGSDFSPHQLLGFYLDELKEMCEKYIEFPHLIVDKWSKFLHNNNRIEEGSLSGRVDRRKKVSDESVGP